MEWERWRNPNSIRVTSLIINARTDQGTNHTTYSATQSRDELRW